jgi:phosphoribosyl 1,2-cyclic phosphate phosphodiesterase
MTLVYTILGCGASPGVPRVGNDWGACDPANPKNRRRRCSLLVERHGRNGTTKILIDTGPDLREQLLAAQVRHVDGVLYSHDHADHTHGIDDLRMLAYINRRLVPVYFDEPVARTLWQRFGYCFETQPGSSYPPILKGHPMRAGELLTIDGPGGPVEVMPFTQFHGDINSLGFRIGGLAYSCDLAGLPPESLPHVQGLDVWIVDALKYVPHPSHLGLDDALNWIERMKPRRALLTHMTADLDYDEVLKRCPEGVEPAYDGLRIELPY